MALATDDLRHPLMAHVQRLGDVNHRHVFAVGSPDRLIAVFAELLGFGFELALPLGVGLREGFQTGPGLRCFSFRAGDCRIVRPISANRLA